MAHNRFLLGLIWRIAPLRVCAQVLERCFSLSYGAFYTLIFFRYLINHLAEGAPFSRILSFLLLFTAIGLTDAAIKAWFHNLYQPRTDQLIRERLAVLLYNKAVNADLASREDPEAYDRYTRAAEQCSARCLRLLELLAGTAGLLLATALNAAFVLWADPSALALCIVPIALVFYFQRRRGVRAARLDREATPHLRRAEYVKRVAYLPQYAKELRLTPILGVLGHTFDEAIRALGENARKQGLLVALNRFAAEFAMQILLLVGLYGYIAWRYLAWNAFTLGDLASLTGAMTNLSSFVEDLANNYAQLRQNELYAADFQQILEQAPAIRSGSAPCDCRGSVVFHNVSFSYPGRGPALRDVNLVLRPGERVAIVGRNGAGKSTLVKLLLRLYDPDTGSIRIGGQDLRQVRLGDLRAGIATAFQDFRVYGATAAENVLMGPCETPADRARAEQALGAAGLDLPGEAVLTREFAGDGRILSGGQAQKLAVARVFASPAPIAVLDEPSAALDPLSEARLYETLLAAGGSRTLLFISHRLSSVRDVDRIYMMDHGRIVEEGTHHELMRRNGLYAEMFRKQAQRYREGDAL